MKATLKLVVEVDADKMRPRLKLAAGDSTAVGFADYLRTRLPRMGAAVEGCVVEVIECGGHAAVMDVHVTS